MQHQSPFRNLTSEQVIAELARYRTGERKATVRVLMLLAEADRRKLYAGLGYSSLYEYCLEELHYSEHEAYLRIGVARAARRYPRLFDMLENGELHLTGAARVAPQLTDENADEILDAVVHKTKREIEEILVHWNPQEDVPDSMMPVAGDHPNSTIPLSPGRFSICFTATGRCVDLINEARALSAHRAPHAALGEVVEAALEAYVEKLEKERFKKTDRPRPPREEPSEDPRHIPAQVMREVHERDGGRCTYVGPNGRRCRARAFLELDHIDPISKGGRSIASNLRLRCATHNQLAAREALGEEYVSMRADGFHPVRSHAARSERLVPERVKKEGIAIWNRFMAPPGEPDLVTAIRRRRIEAAAGRRVPDPAQS
jgi:hypothetical protein